MGGLARTTKKSPYVKNAQQLTQRSLKSLSRLLIFTGKPIYYAIFLAIIASLYFVYLVGRVTRLFFKQLLTRLINLLHLGIDKTQQIKKDIKASSRKTKKSFSKYQKQQLRKLNKTRTRIIISKKKVSKLRLPEISTPIDSIYSPLRNNFKTIKKSAIALFTKVNNFLLAPSIIKIPKPAVPKLRLPSYKPRIKFTYKKIHIVRPKTKISKIKIAVAFATFSIVFVTATGYFTWVKILKDLPKPQELSERNMEVTTKIYDRNGLLLYKIYKDKNRTIVPLEQISTNTQLATLAAEDAEFYTHPGISAKGIIRAVIRNARRKDLSGGSTITQQLVKNALLTPEKTIDRKIKEVILAIRVETTFTKDEILEMYLNEVSYGGIIYGIQEASRYYFDKDVEKLTLAESALLAGLPKSPTKFSPFGPTPKLGLARQKEILELMDTNGYITQKQKTNAFKQKLVFAPNKTDILAPHFVMYTRSILEDEYTKQVVETGGLEVVTTLDYRIQELAEKVVKQEIDSLKRLQVGNAAVIVMDPKSGEILAMVGSVDYFDTQNDGNVNTATALRQPGSSIKIVNYARALSNGMTLATIIDDSPVSFYVDGQPPYSPKNYGGDFKGKITLRSALAESRNVPAVKVLASYGVSNMIEQGKLMGITTWEDKNRFGLSLTLGGGEVKLTDLAKAYATVANYGKRTDEKVVLKVTNYKGKVLNNGECNRKDRSNIIIASSIIGSVNASQNMSGFGDLLVNKDCESPQVVDPRVAYLLIDILKDNEARAPVFGRHSQLVIPNHPEVAVKTGTSNNLRDNLTVGFNQKYLVAVWVGNNDNSPMSRVASGLTGASTIFNKIMRALLANEESREWEVPQGLVQAPICSITGTLPCSGCPTRSEWFLEGTTPKYACHPETIKTGSTKKEKNRS